MPASSTIINVNVSLETFNEIANALEASGKKINADAPLTITKDTKIKGPIDYRQVTIRKDVLMEVVKVYKTPIDGNEYEVSDSKHFINFFDDVYNYVLKGKVTAEPTTETKPKANTWQ